MYRSIILSSYFHARKHIVVLLLLTEIKYFRYPSTAVIAAKDKQLLTDTRWAYRRRGGELGPVVASINARVIVGTSCRIRCLIFIRFLTGWRCLFLVIYVSTTEYDYDEKTPNNSAYGVDCLPGYSGGV
jgi:hypothetical protein